MKFLYSLASFGIAPLLTLWLKRRVARGKEDPLRLYERFGYASVDRPAGKLAWLHAASVGETQSVLTLSRALLEKHPQLSLLITTGTVTSAALIAGQNLPRTIHQFVPVDTYVAVRRFLDQWKPDLVLWVESEFWPQILWQLKARNVPVLLINARLSARSAKGWRRWPGLIKSILGCFTSIYASSAEDAARLRALGAREVIEAGNLKYDAAALPVNEVSFAHLKSGIGNRPLWVAASTHGNEEQMIAEAHTKLVQKYPNLLTIIVPRHAARGDSVAADLRAKRLSLAQRSKSEPITATTGIYLADTMGELGIFYHLSPIAFLGGSLVAHGGHNPLEPARLSCALLTGPHTHNFAAIMSGLQNSGAVGVVHNVTELEQAVATLLADPSEADHMAQCAQGMVASARGASDRILSEISILLEHPYDQNTRMVA